ncbi:hypothetical protein [uncultured Roseovarius sp.]|uniref:hypothetical protein n=1 Tax=uncultured Roseovarius sp. TaxID=293344 RepID=UPI00262BBB93|nr:hypothetical protein [uncultured Roseovarius sp.]
MLTDPDYGQHAARTPPEELLVFSILSRAILDLFGSVGLTADADEAKTARQEALIFLTQRTGGWAKRRNELCDAIGIDGDDMRARVVRVLEGDTLALETYETRGALTHVAEARALWVHEKGAIERAREATIEAKRYRRNVSTSTSTKPPRNTITKYSEVRPIIFKLLDRPRAFKDLITATNGDVSDSTIRDVLRIGIEKGDVIKPESATYVLASVPQTAVAAATG